MAKVASNYRFNSQKTFNVNQTGFHEKSTLVLMKRVQEYKNVGFVQVLSVSSSSQGKLIDRVGYVVWENSYWYVLLW